MCCLSSGGHACSPFLDGIRGIRHQPSGDTHWCARVVPWHGFVHRRIHVLPMGEASVLDHLHLLQRVWDMGHSGHPRPGGTSLKNIQLRQRRDADRPACIIDKPRIGYRMPKAKMGRRYPQKVCK